MLRPLHVWETNADGTVKLGEDGKPIALKGAKAGQPKSDKELSADERRFMAKQLEEEQDFLLRRGRAEKDAAALRALGAEAIAREGRAE